MKKKHGHVLLLNSHSSLSFTLNGSRYLGQDKLPASLCLQMYHLIMKTSLLMVFWRIIFNLAVNVICKSVKLIYFVYTNHILHWSFWFTFYSGILLIYFSLSFRCAFIHFWDLRRFISCFELFVSIPSF